METVLIEAKMRSEQTKGSNNRMRGQSFVPAVLYGKEVENTSIVVSEKEMDKIIAQGGENVFARMSLDKEGSIEDYNVILKEVQRHPVKGTLSHIDFYQVSMSEKLNTVVPISLVGDCIGIAEGGMLQHMLRELDIRCLPSDIPSSIEVDISNLNIGDSILVSQIQTTEDVEIVEDPNTVIVSIASPQAEETEEEETEAGGLGEETPEAEDAE
ncbi:MAG: hypothetical protein APF76_15625 [Desulfitibacter sp. BRH_c19]|nr:MAG: hypothetical protein APF76_15625 [Desulfitibacter sp. BRH_c19]